VDIFDRFNCRHCDRLESPATGNRQKGASVHPGKNRLLILPFLLALIVSIVIVINPVEAKRGGHGHDHSDGPGHGNCHDHDDDGDDDGDDDNGGGTTTNGNGNGKSKPSRDRDGGGECASVDGVNPCIMARPKPRPQPVEIAPGVFQYYGAFGQVIGTAIITLADPTSSPAPAVIVPRETIQEPEPVAIVKKASHDPKPEKTQVERKRSIQPPEKSADPILDVLILQALERTDPEPVPDPELVIVPVQSVPACECSAQ